MASAHRVPASGVYARRTDGQTEVMDSEPPLQRCLIVDDNPAFVDAASHLLSQQGLPVVGAAQSSEEAIVRVGELRPDVVLIDVNLGHDNGFELAERVHRGRWDVLPAVVVISTRADEDFTDLIARSPAAGFVTKADLSAEVIRRLCESPCGSSSLDGRLDER